MAIPDTAPAPADRCDADNDQGWHFSSTLALTLLLPLLFGLQGPIRQVLSAPVMQSWMTVFVAVLVQALPFLVLGVALSAAIAVFVPASFFARALPSRATLAVPVAGLAERCYPAAVRVRAGRRCPRATWCHPPPRWRFSCPPGVNPIVLTATAVAFPGDRRWFSPGRASLLVACVMGYCGSGSAAAQLPPRPPAADDLGKGAAFWDSLRHGVMHAGGFLVAAAATLKTVVPAGWLQAAADTGGVSARLAIFAVLLSICSEADAFVAAS